MNSFLDEHGESLIQFIVGTLAGALLLTFIASALSGTMQIGATQSSRQATELASDVFSQRIGAEGDSATSVFIPSHDIFGSANAVVNTPTTGGVIGQPATGAHEVDFMQRGVGVLGLVGLFDKWWAYYYDAGTHQLIKYTYTTRSAAGLATGVSAPGATISNVRSFNASYLPASQIPQVEHYVNAAGAIPTDVLIQTGYPEVYEGNRGVVLWIDSTSLKSATSNPKLLHYIYLIPASAPQAPIVNYTWSPPPAQALVAAPSITFASNGAGGWLAGNPSGTITVDELYYHRGFTNSGCVSSGGTTVATLSGPNNLIRGFDNVANDPPTSFPGEWEQYSVTPVAAGSCTVTFASSTAAPDPDDKTASVTITVADPIVSLRSWPQQLTLGENGASVGTTSGTSPIALSDDLDVALAPVLNALLGGGTARGAASPQPCYALAQTAGTSPVPDSSLPGAVSSVLGVYVDANACEVDANDNPLPATSVGAIAYNGASTSEVYQQTSNCEAGTVSGWLTTNTAAESLLGAQGQGPGTCSVTFSISGQPTQTPTVGSGLVGVSVHSSQYCVPNQTPACALLAVLFNTTAVGGEPNSPNGTYAVEFLMSDGSPQTFTTTVTLDNVNDGVWEYVTGSFPNVNGSPYCALPSTGVGIGDPDVSFLGGDPSVGADVYNIAGGTLNIPANSGYVNGIATSDDTGFNGGTAENFVSWPTTYTASDGTVYNLDPSAAANAALQQFNPAIVNDDSRSSGWHQTAQLYVCM